jgi:hypothetical protein
LNELENEEYYLSLSMSDEKITDSKLYELATEAKKNIEERREDINKYFTSLFTAIISVVPFIDKIPIKDCTALKQYDSVHILLCFLSVIGLSLSFSWILSLKRICHNIVAYDEFMMKMEEKYNKRFIIHTKQYLDKVGSPAMVTKNEMVVPYIFLIIFAMILVYSILILTSN